MDIKAIINSCQYENEKSKLDLEQWLKAVTPLLDGKNIKEALEDEQVLCKMLQLQKNSGVSAQNHTRIKRHINTLQAFYGACLVVPSRETVLKTKKQVCFYKNLESLLGFVDKVGENIFSDYSSADDLLNVKSIAILGWHGFTLAEITTFEKSFLRGGEENCSVGEIIINPEFFTILKRFASTDEYRGLPSGRLQKYKSDDKYLFRSIIKDQLVTENHLADTLKRFNRIAETFNGAIVFRNLRDNALYVEIAKEMPIENLSHKIENVFNYDIKTAGRKKTEFLHWYKNIYTSSK